jgi:DNA-binding NarL/FixJ family response regulator
MIEPRSAGLARLRILLAEDHAMVRAGVRSLLEGAGMEVVGEAGDGRQLLSLARELRPDVVVLDVAMPVMNGIESARELRSADPRVGIVVLSMHGDPQYIAESFRAGATGYVLKDSAFSELLSAVQDVAAGRVYMTPAVSNTAFHDYIRRVRNEEPATELDRLSGRERQVLQLIAEGHTSPEIAGTLHISTHTVDTHRRRIMEKLELHNVVDLVKFALRHGLTSLD